MMRVLQCIGLVVVLSLPAFSQGSQGAIQGAVFDSSGANIPGATVTITDVDRGTTRVLISDEAGQYAATGLTPGNYKVRAELTDATSQTIGSRRRELDILVYTGYEPTEFSAAQRLAIRSADVLITGRFDVAAAAGGLTQFVGREDELRSLVNRWERAREARVRWR